jgi:hypothetical protein
MCGYLTACDALRVLLVEDQSLAAAGVLGRLLQPFQQSAWRAGQPACVGQGAHQVWGVGARHGGQNGRWRGAWRGWDVLGCMHACMHAKLSPPSPSHMHTYSSHPSPALPSLRDDLEANMYTNTPTDTTGLAFSYTFDPQYIRSSQDGRVRPVVGLGSG